MASTQSRGKISFPLELALALPFVCSPWSLGLSAELLLELILPWGPATYFMPCC